MLYLTYNVVESDLLAFFQLYLWAIKTPKSSQNYWSRTLNACVGNHTAKFSQHWGRHLGMLKINAELPLITYHVILLKLVHCVLLSSKTKICFLKERRNFIPWLYWEYLWPVLYEGVSRFIWRVILYVSTFAGLPCTSVIPNARHWNPRWRPAVPWIQTQFESMGRFNFCKE